MGTPWLGQQELVEKLLKGKQSATQLQTLLRKPVKDRGSLAAEELTGEVVRSFTESLSILSFHDPGNEMTQIVVSDGTVRACLSNRTSKTSDGIRKRPVGKERRGCYKRSNVSESRVKVSPTQEDGYAWRKYGQKDILRAEFPRCYFRCTHKLDQGCKAIKQVQVIKHDPLSYQIAYFGDHTCHDPMRAPSIVSGESGPLDSCLLSFETQLPTPTPTSTPSKRSGSLCSGIAIPSTTRDKKQLVKEDTQSAISDYQAFWQDLKTSDNQSSAPADAKMSNHSHHHQQQHDQEVVSSSLSSDYTTNLHDLDMEVFSKLVDLDDDFFRD